MTELGLIGVYSAVLLMLVLGQEIWLTVVRSSARTRCACGLTLLCLAAAYSPKSPAGVARFEQPVPHVHFVLVGVDQLENDPISGRLPGVARDIANVTAALDSSRNSLTGEVTTLQGKAATHENILNAIQQTKLRAKDGDFIAIYWSGHSIPSPVDDDVHLIPYDGFNEARSASMTSVAAAGAVTSEVSRSASSPGRVLSLAKDIIPLSSARNPLLLLGDGCNVGDGLAGRMSRDFPYFVALSSTKADEVAYDSINGTTFGQALSDGLRGAAADLDHDGFISAEEMHHFVYPRVASRVSGGTQHPTIAGRWSHRLLLARHIPPATTVPVQDKALMEDVAAAPQIVSINERPVSGSRFDAQTQAILLSEPDRSLLESGVNVIRTTAREIVVWNERQKLKRFENPYGRSRALIVAIDDYDRVLDPSRGKTGLTPLLHMVANARKLKTRLLQLGFEEGDIITRFNDEADSDSLEKILKSFWDGGALAKTDRLFIYFGGHGIARDGSAWFPTYDYDPTRPKLTSVAMDDLTNRHMVNIAAKHVLVALDACHAGLALPGALTDEQTVEADADFARLSIIAADVSRKSRNVLVAGTEDEKALYINGGIFTGALIEGLSGKGDLNRDSVIQLDELSSYVRNAVVTRARQTQMEQAPSSHVLNRLGAGRVLFMTRTSGK